MLLTRYNMWMLKVPHSYLTYSRMWNDPYFLLISLSYQLLNKSCTVITAGSKPPSNLSHLCHVHTQPSSVLLQTIDRRWAEFFMRISSYRLIPLYKPDGLQYFIWERGSERFGNIPNLMQLFSTWHPLCVLELQCVSQNSLTMLTGTIIMPIHLKSSKLWKVI